MKQEKYYPRLKEPEIHYTVNTHYPSDILRLLEGEISSRDLFTKLLKVTGLTIQNIAQYIFEITPKTFIKYKNTEVQLPSRIAELALELKKLYELGNDLFGDNTAFNLWLDKENSFCYHKAPRSYLNTSAGIHLIYEELKRIEFGATA